MTAKTPAQIRAELIELHEEHDALLDEIFEHAGDAELCGDTGPEDIAVAYVRRLEAEGGQLRELAAEILAKFGSSGSGHTARVGQVQIGKWRKRAGLPT